MLALDSYITALGVLSRLSDDHAARDRLEAIATSLRERLDKIAPERGHLRSQSGEQVTAESLLTDVGASITPPAARPRLRAARTGLRTRA